MISSAQWRSPRSKSSPINKCVLAARTGALLRWLLFAVLALRRTLRLALHPVLFAKIYLYFWPST